jgi:hypothetical protein
MDPNYSCGGLGMFRICGMVRGGGVEGTGVEGAMEGGVYCIGGAESSDEESSVFPLSSGLSSSGLCACAGF